MIEKQESKDLVRDDFKKEENDFDDLSDVKSLFIALRRYSMELTVGVFGVSMLYVFAYMSSSNLPLSLLSINSGIKVTVLFSLLLILVLLCVLVVAGSGVFYGCYVSRVARRIGCDNSKRLRVILLFVLSVVVHSASLAFLLSISKAYNGGASDYIVIGVLIVLYLFFLRVFAGLFIYQWGLGGFIISGFI